MDSETPPPSGKESMGPTGGPKTGTTVFETTVKMTDPVTV